MKISFFLLLITNNIISGINQRINFIDNDKILDDKIKTDINNAMIIIDSFFQSLNSEIKINYPTIRVYKLKEAFNQIAFKVLKDSTCLGFYWVKKNEIHLPFIFGFYKNCFHELSHSVINQYYKYPPDWLSEGFSMYFEDLIISSDSIYISYDKTKIKRSNKIIKSNYLKFRRIFFVDHSKFMNYNHSYLVSWGIIRYLITYRVSLLKNILLNLDSNHPAEIIRKEYRGGMKQLWIDIYTTMNDQEKSSKL